MDEEKTRHQLAFGPVDLGRSVVIGAIIAGLVGGFAGSWLWLRVAPSSTRVSQQQLTVTENSAVVNVAKKVSPSVVSITSQADTTDFFGLSQTQEGAGTGIVLTRDGLILTNNHV